MALVWTILNIMAIVALMVVFVRTAKEISQRIGMYAAVFFVVIILFGSGNKASRDTVTYKPDDRAESHAHQIKQVVLWDNAVNEGVLSISYRKTPDGQYAILDKKLQVNGLIVGKQWTVRNINVEPMEQGNTFEYFATATVDWQLLGKTIVNEGVAYSGRTTLD